MNQEEQLSSYSTFFKIYLSLGVALAGLVTIIVISFTSKFYNQMIPGLIIVGLLLASSIYKLIFTCDAFLVGDQLALKKRFRPMKLYAFNQIHSVKAAVSRNMENVTLKMENTDGSIEKYMMQCFIAPTDAGIDKVSDLLLDLRNGIKR
jgi:hypothetical protein